MFSLKIVKDSMIIISTVQKVLLVIVCILALGGHNLILVTSSKVMCITCCTSHVNNLQKNREVACKIIGKLDCLPFTIGFQNEFQLESET